MNIIIYVLSILSLTVIGEDIPWRQINLIHFAYLLLQLELASVCFGISAFIRKGSIGIGLGIAAAMYFLNIISNITTSAEFLKYITPFGYCDGAEIAEKGNLDLIKVAIGISVSALCIALAYLKYKKKDLH